MFLFFWYRSIESIVYWDRFGGFAKAVARVVTVGVTTEKGLYKYLYQLFPFPQPKENCTGNL